MTRRVALAALFALTISCEASADGMRRETVTLSTRTGSASISAEIAASGPEQEQGLMFRTRLGDNEGMLFVYPKPHILSMWMRNTYVSLDMVFIGANGSIAHILEGAEPLSERVISSREAVVSVLELKAGTVRRLGLQRGDTVAAPSLPGT
jgi:uncharacterized protein